MPKSYRKPTDVVWTEPMMARFRALHADDKLSFNDMAAVLMEEYSVTLTRNACIGKGRRMSLPQRKRGAVEALRRERRAAIPAKSTPVPPEVVPCAVPRWPVLVPPRPTGYGDKITIFELNRNTCHWPFGDRTPYLFCGAPTAGKVYCAFHTGVSGGHSAQRQRVPA